MILTVLFTLLSALYDNGKRFINHTPRFIFRAVVVAIISYFESGNFLINYIQNAAVFYLLFDYTLNILEGRKWNYLGCTAKFDRFFHSWGGWKAQLIFKILFLITTYKLEWILKFLENGPFGLW